MSSQADLFFARVDKSGTAENQHCWVWRGRAVRGYGRFSFRGRTLIAHRVAYQLMVGPIPHGLDLDHLCRNRSCVNPVHLEPVTRAENVRRAARSHCRQGHAYVDFGFMTPQGWRRCRVCRRQAWQKADRRARERDRAAKAVTS